MGSGKSSVAAMFAGLGAKVIDADKISHRLIRAGRPAYKKIIRIFGRGVLSKDKEIDRKALGRIAFSDHTLLKKLDGCLHPAIIAEIKKSIRKAAPGIIVLDAPLLLEAGLGGIVDKLIVVIVSEAKQVQRIGKKRRLTKSEILKRSGAQIPLEEKAALADFIIDNNAALKKTKEQVTQIWRQVWKN